MSIARCKNILCQEIIITTEHLDKENALCINCIMTEFVESKIDGYIICKRCGVSISLRLQQAIEHLKECSHKQSNQSQDKARSTKPDNHTHGNYPDTLRGSEENKK